MRKLSLHELQTSRSTSRDSGHDQIVAQLRYHQALAGLRDHRGTDLGHGVVACAAVRLDASSTLSFGFVAFPSWAILVRTSVVVRRSWSTYATDTAPLARSATAPLSQMQGIQAQPNRPVTAPVTGHFLPLLRLATSCR